MSNITQTYKKKVSLEDAAYSTNEKSIYGFSSGSSGANLSGYALLAGRDGDILHIDEIQGYTNNSVISGVTVAGVPIDQTIDWSYISGTPTSINGYGITDAYTKSEVYTQSYIDANFDNYLGWRLQTFGGTLYDIAADQVVTFRAGSGLGVTFDGATVEYTLDAAYSAGAGIDIDSAGVISVDLDTNPGLQFKSSVGALSVMWGSDDDPNHGYVAYSDHGHSHFTNTSNPHSVTYAQLGGTPDVYWTRSGVILDTKTAGDVVRIGQDNSGYLDFIGNIDIRDDGSKAITIGYPLYNHLRIGVGAGNDTMTGSGNLLIGGSAGNDLTSSPYNMFIGDQAAPVLKDGTGYNVGLGRYAFRRGTAFHHSVAIGYTSFEYFNGGYGITIGAHSSRYLLGGYNTMIGYQAGYGNTDHVTSTGHSNFGLGYQALFRIETGSYNWVSGRSAGSYVTSGSGNLLVGYLTGKRYTDENYNIVIGYNMQGTVGDSNHIRIGVSNRSVIEGNATSGSEWMGTSYEARFDTITEYTTSAGININAAVSLKDILADETETYLVAIDNTTGLLSKRTVSGILYHDFKFSTTTTDSDPGSGYLRFNNSTYASVTYIYIDTNAANGIDVSSIISSIKTNDTIAVQSIISLTSAVYFDVSGDVIDGTGYYKIPVTYNAKGSGTLVSGEALELNIGVAYYNYYLESVTATDITSVDFNMAGGLADITGVDFGHNFTKHNDVYITSLATDDIIKWDGSHWINAVMSGGDVSISGTPINNQIAIWTDDTTIEGDSNLTFDSVAGEMTLDNTTLNIGNSSMFSEQVTFDGDTSAGLRLYNSTGYISLTPLGSGWAHIYTDMSKFIFNRDVWSTHGGFFSYDTADLELGANDPGSLFIRNADDTVDITTALHVDTIGEYTSSASVEITSGLKLSGLSSATASNVLYYNAGVITYGAAPSGGTGGEWTYDSTPHNLYSTGAGNGSMTATNVFLGGYQAGVSVTSADYLIAIGSYAASEVTDSTQVVAIGYEALRYNSGDYNIAIGSGAGKSVTGSTSGSYNLFIGWEAGMNTQDNGTRNVYMGYRAGRAGTTGSYNVGIGLGSLLSNVNSRYNIGIGAETLYYYAYTGTTGANVAIGRQAGYGVSGSTTGHGNVFIGNEAGKVFTTASYNTVIGYLAGDGLTTGYHNTVIGDSIDVTATTDYQLAIGVNGVTLFEGSGTSGSEWVGTDYELRTDTIKEYGAGVGVTVEAVKMLDGYITMATTAPATPIGGRGIFYAKYNGSEAEAYFKDENGTDFNLQESINYGSSQQIPYTNTTGDGFLYNSNFYFTGTIFELGAAGYKFSVKNGTSNQWWVDDNEMHFIVSSTDRMKFLPVVANGSTALAYMFDTSASLTTAGAKLMSIRNNGTERFYVDYLGKTWADDDSYADDFVQNSDPRLKNIKESISNGLNLALSLNPIYFNWKEDKKNKGEQVGFLSTDVGLVHKSLVKQGKDGYEAVTYGKISVINNAAIHQLNGMVETNKEKIVRLESRIKELEKQIK